MPVSKIGRSEAGAREFAASKRQQLARYPKALSDKQRWAVKANPVTIAGLDEAFGSDWAAFGCSCCGERHTLGVAVTGYLGDHIGSFCVECVTCMDGVLDND